MKKREIDSTPSRRLRQNASTSRRAGEAAGHADDRDRRPRAARGPLAARARPLGERLGSRPRHRPSLARQVGGESGDRRELEEVDDLHGQVARGAGGACRGPGASGSECPPRSKKLSWTPTRSSRSTSRQIAAIVSLRGRAGRHEAPRASSGRDAPGAGSARRSTLPFGVSGSDVEDHEGRRHHVLGQRRLQAGSQRRQGARRPASSRPTT